jgi:hypothetical protein
MGSYKNERTRRLEHFDEIVLDSGKEVDGASGDGTTVEVGTKGTLLLDLTVSALGAGTTLTVTVYTSKDATTWRSLGAFTAANATGAERKSFPGCDRYARANWALAGGTTTATYSVSGEAV